MNTTPRRTRSDSGRNRAALIAAARELFAEQGIDAPLDAVARRAGVGNATLYRHFPTRNLLVLETFRIDLGRHMSAIRSARDLESPWSGLVAWVRFCFDDQFANVALAEELASVSSGIDAEVDELREATLDGISALIDAAKVEGRFRSDRTLDDLLLYLQAHAALIDARDASAAATSDRWLELTLAALDTAHPAYPRDSR